MKIIKKTTASNKTMQCCGDQLNIILKKKEKNNLTNCAVSNK